MGRKKKDPAEVQEPKAKKKPKRNLAAELATWYVETFFGRPVDIRFDKQYFAQAKRFVNPDPDPETGEIPIKFDMEDIKSCFIALRDGTFPGLNRRFDTIPFSILTWGDPPYLLQWVVIPQIPYIYENLAYNTWVRKYGRKAIDQHKWDGIYRGWSITNPPESETVIPYEELESIVGEEKALEAHIAFYNMLDAYNHGRSLICNDSAENPY